MCRMLCRRLISRMSAYVVDFWWPIISMDATGSVFFIVELCGPVWVPHRVVTTYLAGRKALSIALGRIYSTSTGHPAPPLASCVGSNREETTRGKKRQDRETGDWWVLRSRELELPSYRVSARGARVLFLLAAL